MKKIIVCTNLRQAGEPSCGYRGSEKLIDYLELEIKHRRLAIIVEKSICLGHCPKGPNVKPLGEAFIHEANISLLDDWLDQYERRLHAKVDR